LLKSAVHICLQRKETRLVDSKSSVSAASQRRDAAHEADSVRHKQLYYEYYGALLRHIADNASITLLCRIGNNVVTFPAETEQQPVALTIQGRIAWSVCSYVTPEVFFGVLVDGEDEKVGQGAEHEMMVKPSP
jgi:hypothetical protein